MRIVTAIALCAALAGCGAIRAVGDRLPRVGDIRGEASDVSGLRFRSRLATTTPDRRGFVVTTRGAARNVDAAYEAARLRAAGHCLGRFGASSILWEREPGAGGVGADGTVVVSGLCTAK